MKNNQARSFVTIMIVIAVSAFFLRIAIEQVIKFNIAQNESSVSSTLKLIAASLENYSTDHAGVYPLTLSALTLSKPAYLDKDYTSQFSSIGYNFSCPRLEASGYSCRGSPSKCRFTGRTVYSITTGGAIISEDCAGK
jgi:hypothetical protein